MISCTAGVSVSSPTAALRLRLIINIVSTAACINRSRISFSQLDPAGFTQTWLTGGDNVKSSPTAWKRSNRISRRYTFQVPCLQIESAWAALHFQCVRHQSSNESRFARKSSLHQSGLRSSLSLIPPHGHIVQSASETLCVPRTLPSPFLTLSHRNSLVPSH